MESCAVILNPISGTARGRLAPDRARVGMPGARSRERTLQIAEGLLELGAVVTAPGLKGIRYLLDVADQRPAAASSLSHRDRMFPSAGLALPASVAS